MSPGQVSTALFYGSRLNNCKSYGCTYSVCSGSKCIVLDTSHGPQNDILCADGSCSQPSPNMKSERHAAYAVRQAFRDSHAGNVIAAGILPGRKQSPFRAELFALMVAMTASLNSIIFTDCRAVWQGILRLQKEGWNELFWLRSPDSDLWRSAWRILQHPGRKLQVEWLESHRSLSSAGGHRMPGRSIIMDL